MNRSLKNQVFLFTCFASAFALAPASFAAEAPQGPAAAVSEAVKQETGVAPEAAPVAEATKEEAPVEVQAEGPKPVEADIKEEPKAEEKAQTKTEIEARPPTEATKAVDPEVAKNDKKYNAAAAKAYESLKAIGKDLEGADSKHFYMIYDNYNVIGAVRTVRGSVSKAVQTCGEHNPDMKESIDARFKEWDGEISGILNEASANIDNMVAAQSYAEPAKIQSALKELDAAREATNAAIDKRPVETPEACKYLLEKMDETQKNLAGLLRSTLVSFGSAYPETGEEPAGAPAADEKKPEEQ